jgi:hypothetical protein
METSFNKICKSIASIRTESQCESIEAMIKTFKDKYKREGHEYSYIYTKYVLLTTGIMVHIQKRIYRITLQWRKHKNRKELINIKTKTNEKLTKSTIGISK